MSVFPGAALIKIPGVKVLRALLLRSPSLGATYCRLQRSDDGLGDFILDREDVFEHPVIALGPDVVPGVGVDQLAGDAHALARLAHAALEDVACAKLGSDLL